MYDIKRVGDVAEEGDVEQIAVVEQRGGLGDCALGLRRGDAVDQQRVGSDPDPERGAQRRLPDGVVAS